jgi:hypothetical protein
VAAPGQRQESRDLLECDLVHWKDFLETRIRLEDQVR